LHGQQFEKDKQTVDVALLWKNFCGLPCSEHLVLFNVSAGAMSCDV